MHERSDGIDFSAEEAREGAAQGKQSHTHIVRLAWIGRERSGAQNCLA